MRRVAEKNISPDEKILELIYTRLDVVKEVVYRNGTLRAYFFRDIWRVEKVRKRFDEKEVLLFKDVLREGAGKGVFQIDDIDMTAELLHYCVKGIEVPYIRGQIGPNLDDMTRDRYVKRLVFGAGIEVPYIRGQIGPNLDDMTRDRYVKRLVFGALRRRSSNG